MSRRVARRPRCRPPRCPRCHCKWRRHRPHWPALPYRPYKRLARRTRPELAALLYLWIATRRARRPPTARKQQQRPWTTLHCPPAGSRDSTRMAAFTTWITCRRLQRGTGPRAAHPPLPTPLLASVAVWARPPTRIWADRAVLAMATWASRVRWRGVTSMMMWRRCLPPLTPPRTRMACRRTQLSRHRTRRTRLIAIPTRLG